MYFVVIIVFLLFVGMFFVYFINVFLVFYRYGFDFYLKNVWRVVEELSEEVYGIVVVIWGSVYIFFIVIFIVLLLLVVYLVFVVDYVLKRLKNVFIIFLDVMVGLLMIIYGIWGVFFFCFVFEGLDYEVFL